MTEKKSFKPFTIRCGARLISYDRPAVMGILNATADSFYDGGRYGTEKQLLDHAEAMLKEGADIIDIGAVSTRPGAVLLTPEEEARRLAPLVTALRKMVSEVVISVDTCFALPAKVAVEAGADIINDISGGAFDSEMFSTVAFTRSYESLSPLIQYTRFCLLGHSKKKVKVYCLFSLTLSENDCPFPTFVSL